MGFGIKRLKKKVGGYIARKRTEGQEIAKIRNRKVFREDSRRTQKKICSGRRSWRRDAKRLRRSWQSIQRTCDCRTKACKAKEKEEEEKEEEKINEIFCNTSEGRT